jgi:hypothetical protein
MRMGAFLLVCFAQSSVCCSAPRCCSYIDIPHLLSESDEEAEGLPPAERQRRRQERLRREAEQRQQALGRALAGQGVVGATPGFDPTPYQQHLQHLAAQQQQQHQQQQQQQQQQQPGFGPQSAQQPFFGR